MNNIFVEFLPPWVEAGTQPAFYDKESGTVLQQTARMYDRVNMLIRMFNKLSKETKEVVEEYIEKFNELHQYVDDYFDNMDVQEEINNKIDAMVADGSFQLILNTYVQPQLQLLDGKISNEAFERQTADSNLQSQITGLASGSPLVASSTSEMTDHSRIYVNTSDGNWYYWDGDSWEIGGVYQSAVDPYDVEDLYHVIFQEDTESQKWKDRYYDNTVGNLLPGAASANWQTCRFNVVAGDYYLVNTIIFGTSVHCAVFADADTRVIARYLVNTANSNKEVSKVLQAPEGAVYLYVNNHSSEDFDVGKVYRKAWEEDLAEINGEIRDLATDVSALELEVFDTDPYNLVDAKRPTIIGYNKTNKNMNFTFITDTHCNGYYGGEKATLNSKLFAKTSNEKFVDFCAFGGDSYSAYNLTHDKGVNACSEMIGYMDNIETLTLPVKGNHEANGKYMALADTSDLDWDNETYYVYSDPDHAYVAITEAEWDGVTPLHTGDFPDTTQIISPSEFYTQMFLRASGEITTDENHPYDGWYYKDFDEYKIRVIVLNAFDSNDGETNAIHGTQLKWFAEEALDLSDKSTPSDWEVLILSHYYSTANNEYTTNMKTVTDAFIAGSTASGTLNSVSYSMDYSGQGAGTIIALIHGHRHADTYANTNDYNHIGVTRGFALVAEQGTAKEYAFDVFTIDKANKVIYETRIGRGNSRSYAYGANPRQLS